MTDLRMPTEGSIRERATNASFARGEDYLEEGAVISLVRRGDYVHAKVEDDDDLSIARIIVRMQEDAILWTQCSCGNQSAGDCKHVVSVLLTCTRCPEDVEVRPAIQQQLGDLSAEALRELWMELVEQKPRMIEWLDEYISLVIQADATDASKDTEIHVPVPVTPPPSTHAKPRKKIDPEGVRWHVNTILHSLDSMAPIEARKRVPEVLEDLRKLLREVVSLLEAQDPQSALIMLETIIDVWSEEWEILPDEYGETVAFWEELAQPLAEALLSLTLTETERDEWYGLLEAWQDELEEHELAPFHLAYAALEEGWDDEQLKEILEGTCEDKEALFRTYQRDGEVSGLAVLRLSVLERLGNAEGYLRLAWAAGLLPEWCRMLIQQGRSEVFFVDGLSLLTEAREALAIAASFREASSLADAIKVVEAGTELPGNERADLLALGRDIAQESGEHTLAIQWACDAFREAPTFTHYRMAEEIAGDEWELHQQSLLQYVQSNGEANSEVFAILLHEHLLDEAIALVEQSEDNEMVVEAIDALWARRPGWALAACQAQIQPILVQGQSHRYDSVRSWLQKACDAAEAQGSLREFKEYVEELLAAHSRKHKLTPHLRDMIADVAKLLKRGRRSVRVLLAMQGRSATDVTPEELQQIQMNDGASAAAYDEFVEGLSPQAQQFLELLEQSGYLQSSEAKESLGIESDRQIGGLVGSIKRRANKCYLQPPYATGMTDAGERFWRWIGRPQQSL